MSTDEILHNALGMLGDDPRLSLWTPDGELVHYDEFAEAFVMPGDTVMVVDEAGEQTPVAGEIFAATGLLTVWVQRMGQVQKERSLRRVQRNPNGGLSSLYSEGQTSHRGPIHGGEIRRVKRMDIVA